MKNEAEKEQLTEGVYFTKKLSLYGRISGHEYVFVSEGFATIRCFEHQNGTISIMSATRGDDTDAKSYERFFGNEEYSFIRIDDYPHQEELINSFRKNFDMLGVLEKCDTNGKRYVFVNLSLCDYSPDALESLVGRLVESVLADLGLPAFYRKAFLRSKIDSQLATRDFFDDILRIGRSEGELDQPVYLSDGMYIYPDGRIDYL